MRESSHGRDKEVELRYRMLGASDKYYLYEVELHTGRHHQIRAQLAKAGAAIRGDLKYGARRSIAGGGIDLHARSLDFEHPVSKAQISIQASPPAGPLWDLCVSVVQGEMGKEK